MSSSHADIDRLYQAPLEQFTAARNQLAASLKKAGDKAAAERVKALGKPSVTAWALNQVWWRHQARVQALVDAGATQRRALVASAQGQKASLRDAEDTRQRAVADVIDAALEMLGGRRAVAPDVQYRIAGSVEALASAGFPPDVEPGRWTRDLQSSGLDALSALAAAAASTPRPTLVPRPLAGSEAGVEPDATHMPEVPKGAGPARAERARDLQAREAAEAAARARAAQQTQAQARVDAMSSAVATATEAAAEAAADEARAREALSAATRRRAELEAALDEARAAEAAARRQLSQATAVASRAELDRARADRDLARAREALETLRTKG